MRQGFPGVIFACGLLGGLAFAQPAPSGRPTGPNRPAATSQPAPSEQQLTAMSVVELLEAGQRALMEKQYETASLYAEKVLARESTNLEGLVLRADLNLEQGNINPARRDYTAVLNVQKSDFRANFGMGRIWLGNRYYRQAIHFLETAVAVAPPDKKVAATVMLAQAYKSGGSLKQALEAVTVALQLKPDSIPALDLLAVTLADGKDLDRAMDASDKLLAACREEFAREPANSSKVYQLLSANKTRLAVLQSSRELLFARDSRGNLVDQVIPGREREAASVLNQILDILVVQQSLQNTLAYHDMRVMAERMVQYDSENAQYWLQYGVLCAKTYDNEKAAEMFHKVLEIDPNNADARQQLELLEGTPKAP